MLVTLEQAARVESAIEAERRFLEDSLTHCPSSLRGELEAMLAKRQELVKQVNAEIVAVAVRLPEEVQVYVPKEAPGESGVRD